MDFLTIQEAVKYTGKAEITIRRLIKKCMMSNDDEQSSENMTSHDQSKNDNIRVVHGEKGRMYTIKSQFLSEYFQMSSHDEQSDKMMSNDDQSNSLLPGTIEIYSEQLKKQQNLIQSQVEIINNLIKQKQESEILFSDTINRLIESENETKKLVQNQQTLQRELQVKIDKILELTQPVMEKTTENQESQEIKPNLVQPRKKFLWIF